MLTACCSLWPEWLSANKLQRDRWDMFTYNAQLTAKTGSYVVAKLPWSVAKVPSITIVSLRVGTATWSEVAKQNHMIGWCLTASLKSSGSSPSSKTHNWPAACLSLCEAAGFDHGQLTAESVMMCLSVLPIKATGTGPAHEYNAHRQ